MKAGQKTSEDLRKRFEEAGFQIVDSGDKSECMEVRKYNCSYIVRCGTDGSWVPDGPPYFLVRGLKCELEDRGYQKFWLCQGRRFPIRVVDLKSLHQFDEEVRGLLGLKSLYHESLGSTCARTVYDRLEGRPDK